MCGTIRTDDSCPIDGEGHRKIHDTDIMNDLIVSPLQEGRINGSHWLHALSCESGCKGHGVLFCNTHIKAAIRKFLAELNQACPLQHGGGNRYNLRILLG